jgi:hypothetical protein
VLVNMLVETATCSNFSLQEIFCFINNNVVNESSEIVFKSIITQCIHAYDVSSVVLSYR